MFIYKAFWIWIVLQKLDISKLYFDFLHNTLILHMHLHTSIQIHHIHSFIGARKRVINAWYQWTAKQAYLEQYPYRNILFMSLNFLKVTRVCKNMLLFFYFNHTS